MAKQIIIATKVAKEVSEVKNYGHCKIEIRVGGELKVILPGESVEVPMDFQIPSGVTLVTK